MACEEGVVISAEGASARVRVERSAMCDSCGSRDSCAALSGKKSIEVSVINEIGAREDDRVTLEVPAGEVLRASAAVYLLPVLGLVAGLAAGTALGHSFSFDPEGAGIIGGVVGLLVGYIPARLMSTGQRARKGMARITSVVR
jgi:sigma-E factor negative regulatory protein RseC